MATKCKVCIKSVYPNDPQINLDGTILHKACAKCTDCGCQITLSNFAKHETPEQLTLLCKTHYFKRFHEGGAYLGGEKFQKKQDREQNLMASDGQPGKAEVQPVPAVVHHHHVAPEPEPEVMIQTEPEPETIVQTEPEPEAMVQAEPELEQVPEPVAESEQEYVAEAKEEIAADPQPYVDPEPYVDPVPVDE